jgi:hypothetical protein
MMTGVTYWTSLPVFRLLPLAIPCLGQAVMFHSYRRTGGKRGEAHIKNTATSAAVAALVTGLLAGTGPAHTATWKETQKGGWERTCHDGGRTVCTVWENPTQQVLCRGCAETPYKVQPPVPGEPVVKAQQQQRHITEKETISYQISNLTQKEVEDFAAQFKQFTGTDLTEKVVLTLQLWAHAAAVDVDVAESNNVVPSSHDSRHCRTASPGDTSCFEQWLYTNLEAENPKVFSPKGSQITKMITTDSSGRVEGVHYCQALSGVITCVIDIEGNTHNQAFWLALKHDQKGLIAQIYLPKPPKESK